jgi:hypothetical protein
LLAANLSDYLGRHAAYIAISFHWYENYEPFIERSLRSIGCVNSVAAVILLTSSVPCVRRKQNWPTMRLAVHAFIAQMISRRM